MLSLFSQQLPHLLLCAFPVPTDFKGEPERG